MRYIRFYFRLSTVIMLIIAAAFFYRMHANKGESTELEQAVKAVRWMFLPHIMARSAFTVAFPDGIPSEFVNYMFSDMGIAEWAPYEGLDDQIAEQYGSMGIPTVPESVGIVPLYPDPDRDRQIVIRFDDIREVVIVDGYEDPTGEPVSTLELRLPNVEPAVGVQQIYEMNMSQGMSDHAF